MKRVKKIERAVAPAVILCVGLVASAFLLEGQPSAAVIETEAPPPTVEVLEVETEAIQIRVVSEGTVAPRTASQVVAEVPGKVIRVESGLEPGAFFEAGDVLARLDRGDLELDVKRARAALERAAADEEFAASKLERQRSLFEQGITSQALVDESQRAARVALATRLEAEANLEQTRRELTRTSIVAPFDGRTLERNIDVGRFVSVGTPIATLHAAEDVEIRLAIPDSELAYLDLPLGGVVDEESTARVTLRSRFAGRIHRWTGRIVRVEAQIDPRTRMVHAIARVERPRDASAADDRPPLSAGLFVEAEIEGRRVEGLIRVPRAALADEGSVWVVDVENRLRRRDIDVFRIERDSVLVSGGLIPTERISLLEPRLAREGLAVRPVRVDTLVRSETDSEPAS